MSAMLDRYLRRDGLFNILPGAVAVHDRYQNRIVTLDPLGSEIWLRIDGKTTLRTIAGDIAGQSGRPLLALLHEATAMTGMMIGEGLIHLSLEPEALPYHLTLPREDHDQAQAEASMRATGWLDDRG